MNRLFSTSFLSLALSIPTTSGREVDHIAFVHVDILPMTIADPGEKDPLLRDQTLIVSEGLIHSLGPASEVEIPEGAQVIDGESKTLMPGLVDMHVHNWDPGQHLLFLANGVTTVRNMFGSPMQRTWRDQIAAGERVGPSIYTAGPIVDGSPPVWPGSRVVTTYEEGVQAVRDQVEAGYDFIKVYTRLTQDAYDGIMSAAHEADIPVMGHVPAAVGIETVLISGQRTVEHLDGYEALLRGAEPAPNENYLETLGVWSRVDPSRVDSAVELSVEAGIYNCVTLIVMQKMMSMDLVEAELQRPFMRYIPKRTKDSWRSMAKDRVVMADVAQAGNAGRTSFTGALAAGGARILLGTDQANPFVAAGFSLHDEIDNLIAAGLSPYTALFAGTRGAAECMEATDTFGSIAPGLRADLLLLDGNPLDEIGFTRRRAGVMVRGVWMPHEELQSKLDALIRSED